MNIDGQHWILVPVHLLDTLEQKIQTVKESLEKKQKTLLQVDNLYMDNN